MQKNLFHFIKSEGYGLVAIHNFIGHQNAKCTIRHVVQFFPVFFTSRLKMKFIADKKAVPAKATQRMIYVERQVAGRPE